MMADVSRETRDRLLILKRLVLGEAKSQNLIAASSIAQFDQRHLEDSLQLLAHVRSGLLVDIGSGAGFPGLVLACCRTDPVHLIEPRAKRAAFLEAAATTLGIAGHTHVHKCAAEKLRMGPAATITARAVAALPALFAMAAHLSTESTLWVLPKGRTAASELAEAEGSWQGVFRLIPSTTDPAASIVLAEAVRPRGAR